MISERARRCSGFEPAPSGSGDLRVAGAKGPLTGSDIFGRITRRSGSPRTRNRRRTSPGHPRDGAPNPRDGGACSGASGRRADGARPPRSARPPRHRRVRFELAIALEQTPAVVASARPARHPTRRDRPLGSSHPAEVRNVSGMCSLAGRPRRSGNTCKVAELGSGRDRYQFEPRRS